MSYIIPYEFSYGAYRPEAVVAFYNLVTGKIFHNMFTRWNWPYNLKIFLDR